jgi:hypothetical protein
VAADISWVEAYEVMIDRKSKSSLIVDPSILRVLKTFVPAITARWPSGDLSRHMTGALAE